MARKHGRTKDDGTKARRGNGTGTLWRKPTGVWYISFIERTADGKRKRISWTTGTKALDEAREVLKANAEKWGYTGVKDKDHENHLNKIKEAEDKFAADREKFAREEAERKAKEEAERRAAEEAAAKAERDRNAVTLAEAFDLYRESKKRRKSSEATLNGHEGQ